LFARRVVFSLKRVDDIFQVIALSRRTFLGLENGCKIGEATWGRCSLIFQKNCPCNGVHLKLAFSTLWSEELQQRKINSSTKT